MGDATSTFEWKTHFVLACITREKVILFTRPDKRMTAACEASQKVIQLVALGLNTQTIGNEIINPFLPTVRVSCDRATSWTSLSISRAFMETWQPYLAMNAFLEGDLSIIGPSTSLVRRAKVMEITGSDYMIRRMVVNPSPGITAQVQPYLQSGVL
ncbi:hypothetical protein BDZ45DRAFT_753729 [Acephala macrosclerotiorum]|nr:hypothetical protein BDZ45DRAFT_753729 [Acephala macrosclerotiorum]